MITLQQRSRRLSADLETPISLFLSLTQNKIPGLLLESAEVDGRWGRYSIIACDYLMTVSCVDARLSLSIKDALPGWTALSDAASGAGGGRYEAGSHHAGSVRLFRV